MVRFSQSFWDKDPYATTGYEVLLKRLKDGRKLCDAVSEFLKQRAKAEDEYGKVLARMAQQASSIEEMGTLGEAWGTLRKETENTGMNHCEIGKKLDDLDRKVKSFREEQRGETAKLDNKMKKLQKDKKSAYDNVLKAKRQYEQRCKELDNATESLEAIASFTPKEEEKLKARKARAKTAQESADRQYQSTIKILEQTHEAWEQEMEVTCDRFQELDEQRIRFLRNEMWLYSNIASQSCVDDDAMCEKVRLDLEKCDDHKDITTFIHNRQTGSERPAPLKYENYYHPSEVNELTLEENVQSKFISLGRNQKQKPVVSKISPDEGPYSFIGSADGQFNSPNETVVAAFDYSAQSPEEVTLRKDDEIEFLYAENKDWGRGILLRTREQGVFPISHVRKR